MLENEFCLQYILNHRNTRRLRVVPSKTRIPAEYDTKTAFTFHDLWWLSRSRLSFEHVQTCRAPHEASTS